MWIICLINFVLVLLSSTVTSEGRGDTGPSKCEEPSTECVRITFIEMDKNKNCVLDEREFRQVFRCKDDYIYKDSFVASVENEAFLHCLSANMMFNYFAKGKNKIRVLDFMKVFDQNNDGKVNAVEFTNIYYKIYLRVELSKFGGFGL